MQVRVFGFRWKATDECVLQAVVDDRFGLRIIRLNDSLSIEVVSDVLCAGSFVHEKWFPCVDKSSGRSKCERCRAKEGNYIYTSFDGFKKDGFSEQELAQIDGAHVVYLALFDKTLIKVGVSQKERKVLRQLEQGSHYTLFIAETPDGVAARQIETLFRKSGIADKIKPSQKKNFLCPELSEEDGKRILLDLFSTHDVILEAFSYLKEYLLDSPEFCSWSDFYGLPSIQSRKKPLHFISLAEGDSVSGKVVALKGSFVVLETPDEFVFIVMKNLFGRVVDFSEKPDGLRLKEVFQSALF